VEKARFTSQTARFTLTCQYHLTYIQQAGCVKFTQGYDCQNKKEKKEKPRSKRKEGNLYHRGIKKI